MGGIYITLFSKLYRTLTELELRDITPKFLPKRERRRVLRVRPPDFDDVVKLLGLGVDGVVELLQPGQQDLVDVDGHRDVHGRGVCVVGALALVDVVVGVDGRLGAQLAAHQLDGAVGDHLVRVHVALGAGARLPNH